MCTIKKVFHEEVYYSGQEPVLEERYELADGSVSRTVSIEELEMYSVYLEEQLASVRILLEKKEMDSIHAETYFKELGE